MFEIVNESPAQYFYEQMRIRKQLALSEWREPRLASFNGGSLDVTAYLELHPALQLPFADFWEIELNHIFYDATQDCIRALVGRGVRKDAQN